MSSVYKRILLAYDGTLKGRAALREGALLAQQLGSEVVLLSVVAEVPGTHVADGAASSTSGQRHEDYKAVLKDGERRLRDAGFEPSARLVSGDPAEEIGACARQMDVDLVIVGHHPQTVLDRWWSGPSGAYLIDRIPCSMLVSQNSIPDEEFAAALAAGRARSSAHGGAHGDAHAGAHGGAHGGAHAGAHGGDSQPAPPAVAASPAPAPASNSAEPGPAPTPAPSSAEPHPAPTPAPSSAEPDAAPTPASNSGEPGSARGRSGVRRARLRKILFLAVPVVLLIGAVAYAMGGRMVSTDDAYVEADKVGVSTDVAGIVKEVAVHENQRVSAGQLLYRLDDLPFQIAARRAEAQVGIARQSLEALQSNYRDAQAQMSQARNDLDYFTTEFRRAQQLRAAHVASETALDEARRNLQAAQQKVISARQQVAGVIANLSGDPEAPIERNPRYLDALAQRDEAERQLAHTVVRAPFAGIVTNVPSIAPGRYLQVQATAFFLVATDHVWVDANPKETQLTNVRPGQAVRVRVDTYPGTSWHGVVESISPAAAQEFSLLPAQNTSGNWVKVVQRIPMRIRVDTTGRDLPELRAGMSAEVSVDTGRRRGIGGLFGGSSGGRS